MNTPRFFRMDPLPGTVAAQQLGCTCDPQANNEGNGLFPSILSTPGARMYAIAEDCPLHNQAAPYDQVCDE